MGFGEDGPFKRNTDDDESPLLERSLEKVDNLTEYGCMVDEFRLRQVPETFMDFLRVCHYQKEDSVLWTYSDNFCLQHTPERRYNESIVGSDIGLEVVVTR